MALNEYCPDCEDSRLVHVTEWAESLMAKIAFPKSQIPFWVENRFNALLTGILILTRIATLRDATTLTELQPRVAIFIQAAQRRGIRCRVLYVRNKPTEHIVLSYKNKNYHVESYPTASHANGPEALRTCNKIDTKVFLQNAGFPSAPGRSYSFRQKDLAVRDAIQSKDFPLVVKPERGTFSRHVTLNIGNEHELRRAIDHACAYQPRFLVEKYIARGSVHRITVVDFKAISVARQQPASVTGNGRDSVEELLRISNIERRALIQDNPHTLTRVIPDLRLSAETREKVPAVNEVVTLTLSPFQRLGSTVVDETDRVSAENMRLCEQVARHFDIRCAGIDIILEDCSRPWNQQTCGILEINNLPCIELHGNKGGERVAEALVDVFFRYYATTS